MNDAVLEEGIIYNFTKTFPVHGYCETQAGLGPVGPIKELGNAIFCLISAGIGLAGFLLSSGRNMSFIYLYMYVMIFAYGIFKAVAHVTLWNGFDKMAEAVLKILTPLVIAGFSSCICIIWSHKSIIYYPLNVILIFTGIYPAVSIVSSSSFYSSWVPWSTFDVLWLVIIAQILLIWCWQDRYNNQNPIMFRTIWYITNGIIVAYILWLIDHFACCLPVACLYLHGWWHICLSLAFYHCVALQAFLMSQRFSATPVLHIWPSEKFPFLKTVKWNDEMPTGGSNTDTVSLVDR